MGNKSKFEFLAFLSLVLISSSARAAGPLTGALDAAADAVVGFARRFDRPGMAENRVLPKPIEGAPEATLPRHPDIHTDFWAYSEKSAFSLESQKIKLLPDEPAVYLPKDPDIEQYAMLTLKNLSAREKPLFLRRLSKIFEDYAVAEVVINSQKPGAGEASQHALEKARDSYRKEIRECITEAAHPLMDAQAARSAFLTTPNIAKITAVGLGVPMAVDLAGRFLFDSPKKELPAPAVNDKAAKPATDSPAGPAPAAPGTTPAATPAR